VSGGTERRSSLAPSFVLAPPTVSWNRRRVRYESINAHAAHPPYAPAVPGALDLLTCCQQFFPPELSAGVKVLYHARSGPNNSLVPPSEIAATEVDVSRDFLPVTPDLLLPALLRQY